MSTPTYDSVNKIWSGPPRTSIYNEDANLGYLILSVIRSSPDRVFQVCDDTGAEMTSMEMYKRTVKIAKSFNDAGLKQNDVVGFLTEDSENLTPVFVACLLLGLPINPLAPVFNEADILHMFQLTKPKVIFSDVASLEKVRNLIDQFDFHCKIFTFGERVEGYQFVDDMITEVDDSAINEFKLEDLDVSSTPAFIMCSSGSTRAAKGISKSHKQCIAQLYLFFSPSLNSESVCFYSGSYWIPWTLFFAFHCLYGFKRIITSEKTTPELYMDIIDRHKVTSAICTPFLAANILRSKNCRALNSVEMVVFGGQKFSENLLVELQKVYPNGKVITSYGSTEMDLVTLSVRGLKGNSAGQVVNNYCLKIVDESNKELGPLEQGEILVKPQVTFMNYYGEPELYSETFSSDGWIRSGDVGYFDDEGFVFIIDRVKNLLKNRGYHFSTTEIEEIINEVEGVVQSCVVGVIGVNDGYDMVYAFVIKEENVDLSESKIIDYVSSRVIEPKRINGGVEFVTKFPLTATGKINVGELKTLAKNIHDNKS